MEFAKVGTGTIQALILGAVLSVVLPVGIMIFWKIKKKEPVTSLLAGVFVFFVFALMIEKSIQALVIMLDHPVSRFINTHPVCLALVTALFAGVFEETGRMAAYRILLKKQTNKETAISYGLGHGGAEIIFILGITFVQYTLYAQMINQGTYQTLIDQVPNQADTFKELAKNIAEFGFGNLCISLLERCSALLFHVGASIMVFAACRKSGAFWLYPLAIGLHTLMDFLAALYALGIWHIPVLLLEGILLLYGIAVLYMSYTRLYKQ